MLLSTQTDTLAARNGEEEAIRLIARAGFDAFDLSLFGMFGKKPYWANEDNYRDTAKRLRKVAEDAGIVCNQAHAPFASSVGEEKRDEEIFQAIVRSMEIASIVGAKNIVVHPKQHLPYITNKKALWDMNMEFYRRLIPYCEEYGIHVATENMWQHNKAAGRIIDSVCARPEEFCGYIDDIGSPWIVGCLDVGHTALTDEDLPDFVRMMGKNRLKALHVHDNDLIADSHTLPFTHKIKFEEFFTALADIGYDGDFTFEADMFIANMPRELEFDALCFMEKVGRYCVTEIEKQSGR